MNEDINESVAEIVYGTQLQSIAKNNQILWYPDGKDAEVAMQEKVNDVDEAKRSLSPKLISPYGKVSTFLAEIDTNRRPSIGQIRYTRGKRTTRLHCIPRHRRLMGLRK